MHGVKTEIDWSGVIIGWPLWSNLVNFRKPGNQINQRSEMVALVQDRLFLISVFWMHRITIFQCKHGPWLQDLPEFQPKAGWPPWSTDLFGLNPSFWQHWVLMRDTNYFFQPRLLITSGVPCCFNRILQMPDYMTCKVVNARAHTRLHVELHMVVHCCGNNCIALVVVPWNQFSWGCLWSVML